MLNTITKNRYINGVNAKIKKNKNNKKLKTKRIKKLCQARPNNNFQIKMYSKTKGKKTKKTTPLNNKR